MLTFWVLNVSVLAVIKMEGEAVVIYVCFDISSKYFK